ncbi:MAG: CDP-glycerol glycerophosphotransferase family protein [Bacilli bacterium]|nr:CDP-glycerol glycerophosphotransferase family protein [Bacilli bacterium]
MNKIKKFLKKLKKVNIEYINKSMYIKYYKKMNIKSKNIVLESRHGKNIDGNIYYIVKELNDNVLYNSYKKFLIVSKDKFKEIKKFIEIKKLKKIKLVKRNSRKYFKLIASSKYLINQTSFDKCFIKKEGQVYLNTWHGTPLKYLGKSSNSDFHKLGNVQKNFFVADYLLYPSEFMMNHMLKDYMLHNISDAKVLLTGYPRNIAFFDDETKKAIRKKLNTEKMKVIAYMPTWRDDRSKNSEIETTISILKRIDKKLTKKQIMYVNLHPFISNNIDYSKFTHIKKFPAQYEIYEFLNSCDILITDYSSVFFDYALTRNKIILYSYDEKEYFKNRGCYFSLEELPFPKTYTISELIKEINNRKVNNYDAFLEKFCKYDNKNAAKDICELVILGKKNNIEVREIEKNDKKNILIYPGNLAKNGITTSLLNIFRNIDKTKYNIYLSYMEIKNDINILKILPEYINYIPIENLINTTLFEKILFKIYYRGDCSEFIKKRIFESMRYEIKRMYGNIKFDSVIQFNGYDPNIIVLYSLFDCNKVIYVHNDMIQECNTKGNSKKHILDYAYNKYDKVVAVTEDIVPPTKTFMKEDKNLVVAHNLIDYKNIITKSKEEIKFDKDTKSNVNLNHLQKVLNNKKYIKFINIGRFSFEKGHRRLMDAFNKTWQKNKNCILIIVGGHGILYKETLKYAESLPSKKNIIIINSILNPFPILKKCDCFVLASLYEGFGLCLVEADILGLQSFTTDIVGPRIFVQKNGGNIVEDSEEGIYTGMQMYLQGKLKKMKVNYEDYNKKAFEEFYSLIDNK